ncbi:MAG: transcription repressor NadR [Clostridiales bacterium]|nr:transcription repressor NadR [Clostridiales bacterium]MCF8023772.1 transcription repressor NadR [Clostridiales bacterium]
MSVSLKRRKNIIKILTEAAGPISGSRLAMQLEVSRQVIVQDVAILRARNYEIMATPQGYVMPREMDSVQKAVLAVNHPPSKTREELNVMVDHGLKVVDVLVEHPIYGELRGYLMLESRQDVSRFLERLEEKKALLLSTLTNGVHLHTVEYRRQEDLQSARAALKENNLLAEE